MWLLIDNYDSFTYMLADYLKQLYHDVLVIKNDTHALSEIIALQPHRIVLSPGPGHPDDYSILHQVINYFHDKIPILGICLGHQAIGRYFGAACIPSGVPKLGKTSSLQILMEHPILEGINKDGATIMHYHSLILKWEEMEETPLQNIATDDDGMCMIVAHKTNSLVLGIQFHPESILTNIGMHLLQNWQKLFQ